MSKVIQNIKNFFKKKPVRIITALIIIAGIMTGIAFGLIAIIRAINKKNPCASQPGTKFDTSINKCVPNNCDSGLEACTHGGAPLYLKCPPTDYCDYSDIEMHFEYDPDSCECKPICKESSKQPFNIDNKTTTILNSNKKPVDTFTCGYPCEFSSDGYCEHPNTDPRNCNISVRKNGDIMAPTGCNHGLDHSSYEICSADERVICLLSGEEAPYYKYKCSDGEVTIQNAPPSLEKLNGTTLQSYCYRTDKCGVGDPDIKIICTSDSECLPHGTCNFDNSILEAKGFNYLGYCSNSNDWFADDNRCRNVNKIGEKKYNSGDEISVTKLLHPPNQKMDDGYSGISLNQPQCKDFEHKPQCLTSDIEGWYCGDIKDISIVINSVPESLSETNPPVSKPETVDDWEYKNKFACCGPKRVVQSDVGINYCCIKNAVNKKCRNTSKYPPNEDWLGVKSKFACSSDENCEQFNKYLYSQLELQSLAVQSGCKTSNMENDKDSCNSKMYCDLKEKKCKFYAGFIDKLDSSTQGTKVSFNKFIIGDDENNKNSIAIPSADINNIRWDARPLVAGNNAGNFMMCTNSAQPKPDYIFGKYDSDGNPSTFGKTSGYSSDIVWGGRAPRHTNSLILNMECIKKGRNEGIYTTNLIQSSADENRYPLDDTTKISGAETDFSCIMDANCDDSVSTVKIGNNPSDTTHLKWNFGAGNYPPTGIYDPSGNKVLLTTESNIECYNLHSQSACEGSQSKPIPPAWDKNSSSFASLCWWHPKTATTPGRCNNICSQYAPPDVKARRPQYNIGDGQNAEGKYSPSGWGPEQISKGGGLKTC